MPFKDHRRQATSVGDVWRGTLTSCHQTEYHTKRRYRYFPVERAAGAETRPTA